MSTLYIVATPIGNLSDLSPRAKETLASVDVVLCEDTRVTGKLLSVNNIHASMTAYHQHSDDRVITDVIDGLREGKSYALVTDAGTPGISDPGGRLVAQVVEALGKDAVIRPIPGPSAAIAALSISGFPTDEFVFLGFPPTKKGRSAFFDRLATIESTVVFYESTHRIEKTLAELASRIGDRRIILCRELTKLHETTYRGTAADVTAALKSTSMKGEFVIVIGPM